MNLNKRDMQNRAFFWDIMLGTYSPQLPHPSLEEINNTFMNSKQQRTLSMDIPRTRPQQISSNKHTQLTNVIAKFCQDSNISYKQGINEIFGVVAIFNDHGLSWEKIYEYGRKVILTYNFYSDCDFLSLQVVFQWIQLLIKFHDYQLFEYLSQFQITPELYATSWILTLFANKMTLECVYLFWEILFCRRDPNLLYFFVLATLISYRQKLLSIDPSMLPQTISGIYISNPHELITIYKKAVDLQLNSPKSGCLPLNVFNLDNQQLKQLQAQLEDISSISINQNELQQQLKKQKCCFCSFKGCIQCRRIELAPELRKYILSSQNLAEMMNYIGGTEKTYTLVETGQVKNVSEQIQVIEDETIDYKISYVCILTKQGFSTYQTQMQTPQIIIPLKSHHVNHIPTQTPLKGLPQEEQENIHKMDKNHIQIQPLIMKKSNKMNPLQRFSKKGLLNKLELQLHLFLPKQPFQLFRCSIKGKQNKKILMICKDFICLLKDNRNLYQFLQQKTDIQQNQIEFNQIIIIQYLYYMIFMRKLSSERTNMQIVSFYFKLPSINEQHKLIYLFKKFTPSLNKDILISLNNQQKQDTKISLQFSSMAETQQCIEASKEYYKACSYLNQ